MEKMASPGEDAMETEDDYVGDALKEEEEEEVARKTLEANQAKENVVGAQLAKVNPPAAQPAAQAAAQAAAGGAGFDTRMDGLFTVRRYDRGVEYAEVYVAKKCYLVGYKDNKDFEVAYDENTKAVIGKLDSKTGLLSFDDGREPVKVSLSATQAAKPGEMQSAVKIYQANEKVNKAAGKAKVKAGRDAELAGLDVQRAEMAYDIANIDNNGAVMLHDEALVRLFSQSLVV